MTEYPRFQLPGTGSSLPLYIIGQTLDGTEWLLQTAPPVGDVGYISKKGVDEVTGSLDWTINRVGIETLRWPAYEYWMEQKRLKGTV